MMLKRLPGLNRLWSGWQQRLRQRRVVREDLFIGQLLKRGNIISQEQLEKALHVQRETLMQEGRAVRLGLTIVDLGYATEREIVDAVNEAYQVEIKSLSDNIREIVAQKHGPLLERLPRPAIPIWLQLSVATILIIVLTIAILGWYVLNKQKDRLYEQTVKVGTVSLNYFANNARIPLLEDDILRLNTLIKEATRVEGVLYAVIVDAEGAIKAHTDIQRIGTRFTPFAADAVPSSRGDVVYFTYRGSRGEPILNLNRVIDFKSRRLGEVHVGISLDFIQELIRRERLSIVVIAAALIGLGLIVAILFGLRFSRPIYRLVTATQEIGGGNYRYRVPVRRNDELGRLAAAFNRMGKELWRNTLTQKSFGKYVGNEVLEMILADPESTWLKSNRNEATIVIADIRDFTSFADAMEPEKVVDLLNEYLEMATAAITRFGGYIDKFIGDAVLGVFGVPVFRRDHVERAVRAALSLQSDLQVRSRQGNPLMASVGISIHNGMVLSGNVGSQSKMEYTVIGDCVNLASRMNAFAGPGEVVISQSVQKRLADLVEVQTLGPQEIKGKSEPMEIYRVTHIRSRPYVEAIH